LELQGPQEFERDEISMRFRPLFLISILLGTVTAVAQFSTYGDIDNNRPGIGFRSSLTGIVRDIGNHPVSGARIELMDLSSGQVVATTYTVASGGFEIPSVANGEYELTVVSGLNESRSRVRFPTMGDVTVTVAGDSSLADRRAGSRNSVSISQMKVPGKARKLFDKALSAFQAAHLDDALNLVQKAIGLYPDYAEALTLRGVMNLQRGNTEKAEPDLQKAVELDYSDSRSFVALAALYNTEGKYDNALLILDRGMSVHPNSWTALSEQARAEIGLHHYDEALKTLAKIDRYAPPTACYLHLFRAQAFLGKNNIPAAVEQIKTFLAKEPNGQNADTARKMLAKLETSGNSEAMK
jgi:tetratricopeptide (TPR) repeat protein